MKSIGKTILLGLGVSLFVLSAQADDQPGDNYISLMGTAIKTDSDRNFDDGIEGGVAKIGGIISEHWNAEFEVGSLNLDPDGPGVNSVEQLYIGINALNVYNRSGSFQPYFLGGLGMVSNDIEGPQRDDTNLYTNLGIGAFVPIFNDAVKLRGEALYRWENSDSNFTDIILNLGVSIPFGRERSEPAPVVAPPPPPPADSDGDGVFDDVDQCPNTPPGVKVDERGCELDSDGDGVPDSKDECPNTPAGAKVDEKGCQIIISLEGVNFRTNSDQLQDGAEAALDDDVLRLEANPGLRVEVAGHTDSTGDAAYNMDLSQRRAATVELYLESKGIAKDRITSRGYGQEQPIADNNTKEGRAANRRVELRVLN
jgi:OOP family OmpA-OmpF porin